MKLKYCLNASGPNSPSRPEGVSRQKSLQSLSVGGTPVKWLLVGDKLCVESYLLLTRRAGVCYSEAPCTLGFSSHASNILIRSRGLIQFDLRQHWLASHFLYTGIHTNQISKSLFILGSKYINRLVDLERIAGRLRSHPLCSQRHNLKHQYRFSCSDCN